MRHRDLLAISSLYFLAFAVRLIPFTISVLPYNIDAYPLIRISDDIIASGHWGIGGEDLIFYNSKMPAFSMILSAFSMFFGIEPFALVSILVPIITSTSVIAIYMLTMKITKSRVASYIAGLFFALSGFYLYLTTAIMKETIGLTLLPIIFYLFIERDDPRKRILAAVLLVLIPFIHHLTALIVFTVIGFMVITDNYQAWKSKILKMKNVFLDFFLGPFLFIFTYSYYNQVRMEQFEKVVNFDPTVPRQVQKKTLAQDI
jgi:4-amino-4-deoxy-L-arabinose transferase-like glycosyltransferase